MYLEKLKYFCLITDYLAKEERETKERKIIKD